MKYKIKNVSGRREHAMKGHDNFVVDMRDLKIYVYRGEGRIETRMTDI